MSTAYDLHWKSIPMRPVPRDYWNNWYRTYLGRGVYLWVLATTDGNYVGYYVGKSDDIGSRWWKHLHDFPGYYLPTNVRAFLENPVAEFNNNAVERGLPQRRKTVQTMLNDTWFCWAEVTCRPWHRTENVEYVLQEGLKIHAGITVDGYIGDAGARYPPTSALAIHNRFGRDFLVPVLPATIIFTVDGGVQHIEVA